MSTSSVRVGIRIRPLVTKEKGQSVIIDSHDNESIVFKGQTFTFDHVFGSDMSQMELYERTAASMLKNVLEGYNCTIIAYGQTGSGKTFTMGTSDVNNNDIGSLGLIPRFVNDLFQNLNDPEDQQITYKVKASFLEIYGEDVYDLLSGHGSNSGNMIARSSLAVREDEHGHVFVQGQIEQDVIDPESALEALSLGSSNRITAATAMNAGSSRSHAVFTLSITQFVKSGEDDLVQNMSSKLTFVDLAGSERIKRTGAEGQRMKEGIQINSGLFNLGQVINSLADEQKLKNGSKPAFVPYRNSKLTHLLKDALGGNSQTLFLACISPAESNESETYSTLSYARQARNIQNKPVKNMDETQAELRRLKLGMRTWMLKAVKLAFGAAGSGAFGGDNMPPSASKANGVFSPGAATLLSQITSSNVNGGYGIASEDDNLLLQRPEVIEFIEAINNSIKEKAVGMSPSPRKVRLSLGVNPASFHSHKSQSNHLLMLSPSGHHNGASAFTSPRRNNRLSVLRRVDTPGGSNNWMLPAFAAEHNAVSCANAAPSGRESILFGLDLSSALEAAGNNVSDSQVLIERMMDVISEEKRILGQQLAHKEANNSGASVTSGDNSGSVNANGESFEFETVVVDGEDNEDEEELKVVDKLIAEKEEILNKLMENIKGYSALKMEFEKLVDAINGLELEKKDLEMELERAKKGNQSSAQLEKIKERFTTVKEELRKMKEDRKTKEQAYKMMQKESKALETMQRELQKLKENKVSLMKQSKSQFNELQKIKKEQAVKMQMLKKIDVKKQQQMNALKSELAKKERIIGHRDKEIGRMAMKLKASEDHITQLLKIQNRNRQTGANSSVNNNSANNGSSNNLYKNSNIPVSSRNLLRNNNNNNNNNNANSGLINLDSAENEHLQTSKAVIDQAVLSQVEKRVCRLLYEKKTLMLKKLNSAMVTEASDLEALFSAKQQLLDEHTPSPTAEGVSTEDGVSAATVAVSQLSPEKKVLLESYEESIKLAEAKIERLTKEIDLFNADIDDLSLQLEKIEKNCDTSNGSVWDTIGNEVVLGLSATQAQALVLDLLAEKTTLSTSLRTSEAEIAQLLNKLEDETAMKLLLAKHVEEMRVTHRSRLVQLEKQRLEDVWAMMKANKQGGAAEVEAEGVQASVLFQKTLSLEHSLEERHTLLQETQQQLAETQRQLADQCGTVSQLQMQLQVYARVNAVANRENEAQGGCVSGFLDAEYLQRLQQLWQDTGCAMEERHMVMDCLLKSQELAKERAMSDAERALKAACEDFVAKETVVKKLMSVLGDTLVADIEAFHIPDWTLLQTMPKIDAVRALEETETQLKTKFDGLLPEMKLLREQLDYYVAEMWLDKEDLTAPLQRLSVLPSTSTSTNNNNSVDNKGVGNATNDKATWTSDMILEELATNDICLALETPRWQEGLKALNLSRVRVTASLITLREQCLGICADLGFFSGSSTTSRTTSETDKQELSQLLAQVFSEDTEVTCRARNAVVQILTQQTSSNPPGAQALLVAFDKLKLLLESVRLNRSTVSSLLDKVRHKFSSDLSVLETSVAQDTAATQCDRQTVETLAERLLSLPKGLTSLKQRLLEEVGDVLTQISGERLTVSQLQQCVAKNVEVFTSETDAVLQVLADSEEELQGMEMFVEERWLQLRIQQILKLLQQRDTEAVFSLTRDILYLSTEKRRLETLKDTMTELQRTDALLTKHMSELEDFEERSKADRVKALTGNSKMLIEEEKFRKNGKKKYETISEKMLQLYNKLQSLAANNGATVAGNVPGTTIVLNQPLEVKISIGGLSGPGQCLLRGGVSKERVELMRLHTAAAAAAAASALLSPTHHLHHHSAAGTNTSSNGSNSSVNNGSNASTRRSSYDKDTSPANNSSSNFNNNGSSSSGKSGNFNSRGTKENNAVAANRVVGGKGVLKSSVSSSSVSSLSSKLKPKTSSHTAVSSTSNTSSSSALSSLASLVIENPLTFASEICPSHHTSNNNTPKVATTLVGVLGGVATSGRRYSFQPPTPPQTHHAVVSSPGVSENDCQHDTVSPDPAAKGLITEEIETITPTLMDI